MDHGCYSALTIEHLHGEGGAVLRTLELPVQVAPGGGSRDRE